MMQPKKFLVRYRIILAVITVVSLSLLVGIYLESQIKKNYPRIKSGVEVKEVKADLYRVVEVLDGDTVKIENQGEIESVRLLGIDAEELSEKNANNKCWAGRAKKELEIKILNKEVELKNDETQGDKDVYGRWLRDVFLEDIWINGWLVEQGLARVYRNYPSGRNQELEDLQQYAQTNVKGFWGEECFYD